MAAETLYTANTGMVLLTNPEPKRDGTGAVTLLTSPSSGNGTYVKRAIIKGIKTSSHGMIRFFVYDGANTKIIKEVPVPAVVRSSTDPTFEAIVNIDFHLEPNGILKVTSENGDSGLGSTNNFVVIAEGLDWSYHATLIRPESSRYTVNSDYDSISTANSNLDGSGTLGNIYRVTATERGALIKSINVKATVSTTLGMIRLFITDTIGNTRLFKEIQVDPVTKGASFISFSHRYDFDGDGFALQSDYTLSASTENAENFNVFVEALEWTNPS